MRRSNSRVGTVMRRCIVALGALSCVSLSSTTGACVTPPPRTHANPTLDSPLDGAKTVPTPSVRSRVNERVGSVKGKQGHRGSKLGRYGDPSILTNHLYRIRSSLSDKVVDIAYMSRAAGASLHQWAWWGGANQRWTIELPSTTDETGVQNEHTDYVIRSLHSGLLLTNPWPNADIPAAM